MERGDYGRTLGLFLAWTTYGTWLPGDQRGWVEYHRGWQLPDPIRELESAARMTEHACRPTSEQRSAVEDQIAETCRHRGWYLHAVNCRSNHVHAVVTAPGIKPKKVRTDLKAWATRRLKERFDPRRENRWTEGGVIREICTDSSLESVIVYVLEGQDKRG